MRKSNRTVAKFLLSGLLILEVLLVGSCDSWMSNDDFMTDIESEVHDANAAPINVYVRYANNKMGTTEPQGSTTMKVDVASKLTAVTNDDYGFVRWAAFSTNDFSPEKQHSKLTFITEENYNENYKSKELPESVVQFSEPTNPVTEVKIFQARDDIFIIPIVASRPAYVQSVPGAGDSSIVKNTSIRILFSKPIDENTILDEEGNLNFSITSSAAVFTDDDSEIEANDITDFFEYKFSDSKKMLTLKLKGDKLLDNRQYITVTLLEGLKDTYGYQMNGNYTFKFTTGTSTDSLAPMIEVIYGGTDDICNLFVTFGEDGQMKGTATNEAKNAPSDIASDKYTEQVVAQRIYDKLNIFVKANDIINSGNADINPAKDLSEDNVALIYIAAGLYINADGSPADFKNTSIAKKNYNYISGTIDPNSQIKKQFTDVVPLDKDGNKYNGGTIYTYDVSSLPDGLIRIDVWAGDMTGNAGGPDDKGAPYIEKHDNGYKSIFVVKDTTPIDSAEVKAQKKVISNSASAPYYWYNLNTLNTMELFDSPENKIQDAGHPKLRALDKNLWWTFKVGNVTESISKDDSTWKRIHDETDGTTSLHYNLANATAPSVDGPVDITLYLKDDMGNMSAPVLLDSIMYDNTAPSVSLKSGKGDFVNAEGNEELHASNPKVIEQILKVTIGESNENNNGSGIRRMEIHVKKGNEEVEAPLDAATFKVLYAPSSIENPTPASEGIRQISVQTAEADSATTNTTKIFNVTDADKITDGTLFIYGLTLGDTDGTYEVNVDLFDSALNKTPVTAVTRIARDTTEPVINKVQILGAQVRKAYGRDDETWWMPLSYYDESGLSKVSFNVDVTETGSGIKLIKLADNIEFTSASKIRTGEKYLNEGSDYILNLENRTIELLNWYEVELKDAAANSITLENVKLNNLNSSAGNKISLVIDDFVDQHSEAKTDFYYNNTSSGSVIFGDTVKPEINNLKILDSAAEQNNNPHSLGYNDRYTDSQNVTLVLNLAAESAHNGSGVKVIHLSDNALFTNSTEIFVDDEILNKSPENYTIAADNMSVEFAKVFTEANVIKFTNVQLISEEQGRQTVNAYLTDFVGLENESKVSEAIIYDNVAPVIGNIEWVAPAGVAKGSANSNEVRDQTFKVDFTEETSGTRVIKFDITYNNETESYNNPFALYDAPNSLRYGDTDLVKGTDYTIFDEDKRYILLNDNRLLKSGTFNFNNLKLRENSAEGQYTIKVTLLDQSENKNQQDENNAAIFKKTIFIDTTAPVISKVIVKDVSPRQVYGNPSDARKWWIPYSKFDSDGNLSKVDLEIKVNEAGSGLKILRLSNDVEFTPATELWAGDARLAEGTDYSIDLSTHTITLLNYEQPLLRGTPAVFTLKNVKLNKFNLEAGNTIGFAVEDFVTNPGSNQNTIYYNENESGSFIYADSVNPEIDTLKIEDAAQNSATNPENKAWNKDNFTDNQNITLTLTLKPENNRFGSGVKTVKLSNNAEFTSGTKVFVNDALLSGGYAFSPDYKSVDFTQVFINNEEIKFTNVNILSQVEGNQIIEADLTDFVGIHTTASTSSNSIILDKTSPVVNQIKWFTDDGTVTEGISNERTVLKQDLKLVFTELTAGVKVIKLDIKYNDMYAEPYSAPFNNVDFKLYEEDGVTEVDGYSRDGKYIILTNPRTSGTLRFHGLTLKNDEAEGTYFINVALFDAAENRIDTDSYANSQNHKSNIVIDTVAPVISKKLEIPGLLQTTELSTETPELDGYWLKKAYIGGDGSGKAPDAIPLYITLKEKSSGVKVLKFVGADNSHPSDVRLSEEATTLWTVAADGTEAEIVPKADRYEVHPDTNEIIIKSELDAKTLFSRQNESEFKLLIKNVGFVNADKNDDEKKASINRIYITASDVAKNVSSAETTKNQHRILSDSISPAAPTGLTLKDRAHSTTNKTIEASAGYTNESIVDMTFNLTDSEKFGSGYHKFVLTGASFIGGDSADKTTITVKDSTGTVIPNVEFTLSDADNDGKTETLILKKTDQATDVYAVIRQAVSVELKNVQLDNASTNGSHEVTLKAYDFTGWESAAASTRITLDTEKPALEKGVFTARYTNSSAAYYQPSINVYPHANGESATGVTINYGTQASPKNVPTFYTATTYNSGYYQFNGVVSSVSSSNSAPNTIFVHGAVLGFRAKDNISLSGWVRQKTFLYYISDDDFSKTEADILAGGTNNTSDIGSYRTSRTDSSGSSQTSAVLWFGFATGKYSAVIIDEAGNCSDVFRFAVVQDTVQPDKEWDSDGKADSLNNRVLLQMPDNSAKVYTNAAITVVDSSKFDRFNSYGSYSDKIRTKSYVTKKTGNKYKIQLNLGGSYSSDTPITKINGKAASSTKAYKDLSATRTSSPIEKYAISTFYGAWPESPTSDYKYLPVVPYGTTFPSGQTHNSSTTSTENISYKLGHEYFYSGQGSNYSNTWRIPDSATMGWHSYTKTSSWNSDKIVSSDSNTEIRSRIDENNNLIIEIPNTQSTAPISVFLRDGCGNMQYVVCGVDTDKDPTSPSYGKEVAISFVVDKKLGHASTTNGKVSSPIIIQNPHMTYVTSDQNVVWPNSTTPGGFIWGNNSGNGSEGGVGGTLGFIKDNVKKATYYNPAIGGLSSAQQFKLGLTLRFDTTKTQRGSPEDVLFNSSLGKVENPDPDSSNTNYSDYTCRALLYCTTSAATPDYDTIIQSALESSNPSQVNSFRTNWVGVRVSNDANLKDEADPSLGYNVYETTILLDYPKPNYTQLGWTVNNSTTHEPIPYYMWYLFEDRVGNYEIAKVVNSSVTNGNVLNGSTTSTAVFDKWLYDYEGPKLSTRETHVDPSNIESNQTAVNALVATNNGYVPYSDGNTVYVRVTDGNNYRASTLINSNAGWGTTHYVEGASYGRKFEPFMDLKVSEITGVRAFAWSNSLTPPTSRTTAVSEGNTHGDSGAWYAGYAVTNLQCDIGVDWSPDDKTNPYFTNSSSVDNIFNNNSTSTSYYSKYSGTKVNTAIPKLLISESEAKDLYLHVMDWTGNISTYHMGNSSMKFINDITSPARHFHQDPTCELTKSVDDEFFVSSKTPDDINYYINVRIAGKGQKALKDEKIKIRLPTEYFTDTYGSGYKGFSFNNYSVNSLDSDSEGPFIEVPSTTYKNWSKNSTGTSCTVYFYDNVGNQDWWGFKCFFDETPPEISSVSLLRASSDSETKIADVTNGIVSDYVDSSGYGKKYTARTATKHTDTDSFGQDEVQTVYLNKTGTTRFHIQLATTIDDLNDIKVNTWDNGSWTDVSSYKSNPDDWNVTGTIYEMIPFNKLSFTSSGTYFQIVATDLSGNTSYQYFKLIKDNEAPNFAATTPKPVVTLRKGSIGKITNNGKDNYYYAADASYPLKLSFGIADSGSGSESALKKFKYSFDGSTWLPANGYISNPDNFEIDISSGNIETFYFMDILGNKQTTALTPELSYTYNASGTSTTVSIPKLTAYTDTPAAPAITTKVVGPNLNDPNSTKYNIVEQVETRGKGLKDDYKTYNKANWTHLYTEKFENVDNTIRIKEQKGYERSKVRITFPEPSNSNKIKGYIKSNTALNIHSYDENQIGKYTFADNFANVFEDTLDTKHAEDAAFTRYYYAVDIVGNISPALILTYSYENPHIPKDVALIDPLNSSTDKSNINYIADAVKTQMERDGIDFAKIIKVTAPQKQNADKKYVKYFSKGFMVVRCTLYQKAGADYSETPNKIELWDKWGETEDDRKLRAESGPADDSTLFKVYPSDEKDGNRYYCWIAFKPGKLTTTAGATEDDPPTYSFEPYVVDNNLEYNGSNFHGFIKGATCQSGFIPLDPESTNADNKVGWMLDKEAPVIEGSTYLTNENHVIGYTASQSLSRSVDNTVGPGYVSVTYQRGTTISIPVANLKDEMSGLAKYKFVVSNQNVDDVNWETATPSNGMYTFTLPPVEAIHKNINLYLQDNLGNVSSTPYTLAHPEAGAEIWWIVNDILTKEGAVTTWGEAPEWTADAENYTFTVMPPEGSIIRKVTVKVDGQEKDSSNANWGTVKFNGYKSNIGQSPDLDGNAGWLLVNDGDKKGLDITVKKIPQDWANHKIEISINDDTNLTKTYNNFVTAKTFSANDVNISKAEDGVVTLSPTETNAPLEIYITDVKAKVGNTEIGAVKSAGENNTVKVTLSGIPAKTWSEQKVTLYINPTDEDADGIKYKDVLTIPAIQTTDISIGTAAWSDADNAYVATVTYSNGAPTSAITTVSSTKATAAFAKQADETTDDTTKILLTNLPAKTWSVQSIDVTVSDGGDTNKITKDDVYTIGALEAGDFTVNGDDTYSNGEYTIAMADGSDLPAIESADISVITKVGETEVTEGAATVAWASPKATVTVTPGWKAQTVILKLKNFELKTINVPAKEIAPSDITIKLNDGTKDITAYPTGEGAVAPTYLKVSITVPTGVTISSVTSGGTDLNDESGGNYGLNGNPIASDVKITIVTSHGNVENVSLFPETASTDGITVQHVAGGAGKTNIKISITPKDGDEIVSVTSIKSNENTDLVKVEKNGDDWQIDSITESGLIPNGPVLEVTTKNNGKFKVTLFEENIDNNYAISITPGASNNNQRSIFGFRTKGNSYSATSTSAGATSEVPKTRSVSLTSWVNDLFNNDSEAAVKTVKDEVKSSSKKSAKKSKKSAKTAKVEKAAAESLAETSAAPVNELAETVAATVSAVTDVVEEAAPAVDEVSASLEAEAAAPLSADSALPEASEESPSASAAAIILAIAALCAAAAALTIIALKKRAAKK